MPAEHAAKAMSSELDLDYARRVIESEAASIRSMSRVVDGDFARAAEMIYDCRGSVIVTGIGKAGIIGQKLSATLASTGTPSHFLHPAEAVHGDLGRVRKKDIVLVLSYGGETDEIVRLINLVKQLEVQLIAITGRADCSLSRYSDVVLCMGELEEVCPLGIAPSASTACMLAIGDALAFTVMKARNFSAEDFARFHPGGSLGAKLITVEQSMMFTREEQLPVAGCDWSIREVLERTSEKALSAESGDSSKARGEMKRHGAVMVVDDGGKLAGIITDADLRRLVAARGAAALDCRVSEVMTAGCKRIRADALASEAMALFHKYRIDELPVVDSQDRPVGLIDVQDIVAIKIVG